MEDTIFTSEERTQVLIAIDAHFSFLKREISANMAKDGSDTEYSLYLKRRFDTLNSAVSKLLSNPKL